MSRWATLVVVLLTGCGRAVLEHPGDFDFGDVALGQTRLATLQLINRGPGDLSLALELTGDDYSLEETARTLREGETMNLRVRFTPSALGPREGTLTLRAAGRESTLALTGRGTGARLAVNAPISLGTIALVQGEPNPIVTVPLAVTNVGTAGSELHLERPTSTSDEVCVGSFDGVGTCTPWTPPPSLGAGARVTVPLQVRPTSAGARVWAVELRSDDPVAPSVSLTLRALVERLEPCALRGPAQALLDDGPRPTPVTLTHAGTGPCQVRAADVESMPAGAFRVFGTQPSLPARLEPGARLTVELTATPGAPRTATGVLHVRPTGGPVLDVSLGFRVPELGQCLVATPSALDFGAVKQSCSSATRNVALYNVCGTPLTLDLRMSAAAGLPPGTPGCPGTAPCPEFSLVSGLPVGTVLEGPEPAIISVRYRPLDLGDDTGALSIDVREAGTWLVSLQGRGDDRSTQVDTWRLEPLPVVDVLTMVDTSPSFASKRAEVRANLSRWLAQPRFASCTDLRWAFAPAEGAPDAGVAFALNDAGVAWTSSLEPDFVGRALSAFDALPTSSETEACIGPAVALMQGVTPRDGGTFAGLCITDALEHSSAPMAALAQLQARLGSPPRTTWNAVTGVSSSTCAIEAADDGVHAALVYASSGSREDVCNAQWWASFQPLGLTSCSTRSQFFLSSRPDGPLEVRVDGAVSTDWSYDAVNNSVVFSSGHEPRPGSTVVARYEPSC
ncbi:MAG: choice-of-anchor D domain-containing protein [Myxococcota bacterium]